MNFKRNKFESEELKIDIPYLINQERALSEKEFKLCLPHLSYEQYFQAFLKRRIVDLFNEYKTADWFKNRYLTQIKQPKKSTDDLSNVIVIHSLAPTQQSFDFLTNSQNIKKYFTSQNNKNQGFTLDVYIIPNSQDVTEEIISSAKNLTYLNIEQINLSDTQFLSKIFCTSEQLSKIFLFLCHLYDLDDNEVKKEFLDSEFVSISNYLTILQEKFNFCPVCCKQYDNNIAMLEQLNRHDPNEISERNLDILGYSKNFKSFISICQNQEQLYTKTLEKNFKCNKCDKIFETVDFVSQHIQRKHQEVSKNSNSCDLEMNNFLKNIDCFFICMCLGIEDNTQPNFFKTLFPSTSVVYDMPAIFSGKF